jgi:hypothetical protein
MCDGSRRFFTQCAQQHNTEKQWISFPDSVLALVGKKNCGTGEQAKQILVGFKLARVHRDVYRNCGATRPLSRMSCSR